MKSIIEYLGYKEYIRSRINEPSSRGLLSRLAAAAQCQRSYLSKVLQPDSNVQLMPDHLHGICEYLNLSDMDSEYLKLLLEKERANQHKYKKFIEGKLSVLREQYLNLKQQIGKGQLGSGDSGAQSQIYYSFWLYPALHIATSIAELQTVTSLSRRFSTSENTIIEHLKVLLSLNLVKQEKNKWIWVSGDIHLSRDSHLILMHHMNWRNQALQDVSSKKSDSLHYSLVQSLSQNDFENLRVLISTWIKSFQTIADPSKPEELICFNLDFFRLGT